MEKKHLYGSDLREALIEVAHLIVSSNASNVGTSQQCTVGKYINCLTPKQCLQFYNCAFIVHQLYCDLFGETKTGLYSHALLGHGPPQHEIVCSRSVNTENEERLFKCAEAAARFTGRKPENMLPGILNWIQCKREAATDNPIKDLHQRNPKN